MGTKVALELRNDKSQIKHRARGESTAIALSWPASRQSGRPLLASLRPSPASLLPFVRHHSLPRQPQPLFNLHTFDCSGGMARGRVGGREQEDMAGG